jgi:predicted  nucleic acid-binding Zn-ribbon protein
VKDLERSTNQLHERLDEKRHEVHQMVEHMTNMEDIFVKVDQHMQQEKDRFIQMQNDAYEAQVRSKEVRSELQGAMKKNPPKIGIEKLPFFTKNEFF